MNKGRLSGKIILITGASQGLGRALAFSFQSENAAGIATVSRHAAQFGHSSDRTRSRTKFLNINADLSKLVEIERVAALTLNEFGGKLDVLVNNASDLGPTPMPLLVDYPLDAFRRVLDTNLTAPFLLTKKFLPAMIESGGSIINVTSDAGHRGYPGWGAYGISKFGLEGLSQTLATELKEEGVRVNLVDPGNMNTAMHRAAEPEEDPTQWADPADVTKVFVYLASDDSRGITGKRFLAQSAKWSSQRRLKEERN